MRWLGWLCAGSAALNALLAIASGIALLFGASGFEAVNFYRPAFYALLTGIFAATYLTEDRA